MVPISGHTDRTSPDFLLKYGYVAHFVKNVAAGEVSQYPLELNLRFLRLPESHPIRASGPS
jgi:hypothetical protein